MFRTPKQLQALGRYARLTANLMIGVPDYEAYVEHMRRRHPEQIPMSYEAFFRNRQQARFDSGTRGCC